ncbi:MAG: hypothetical protein IT385_19315 [Deltaproteobacteria bacterium]|nr:hypothetical protein [Deltaproteobacteria bacterium]
MPSNALVTGLLVVVAAASLACDPRHGAPCPPDRACATASAELCAGGPEAALYGRSAFVDGTCAARDDGACARASLTCRLWGQCSAPTTSVSGACPGGDGERDRDFLASRHLACGAGRTCVAARDEDCRRALACSHEGRCVARAGVCVAASDADCRASAFCADVGWCSLVGRPGEAGRCTAASAEDCRASRACDDWGQCGLAPGGAGCTECERSFDCTQEGLCARVLSGDRCLATEARHCQRAAACRTEGRCRPSQGRCVK